MNLFNCFHRSFYASSLALLLLTGFVLRLNNLESNIIEWPVGSLLSVFVLSGMLYQLRSRLHNWWHIGLSLILFAGIHWVLSGFFEIVLTRFLRYAETYTFATFDRYLTDHLKAIVDGVLWCSAYLGLFHFMTMHAQTNSLARSVAALEEQLNQTDLKRLGNEINPHFLFNAMNGIAMKVRMKENKSAIEMIAALNDLLRLILYGKEVQLIPLRQELDLLEKYILIERSRFGEQFSWSTAISEDLLNCKVPRLILQPLVENAFKHGLDWGEENMVVQLAAEASDGRLSIRLFNTLQKQAVINYASSNVGLTNIVNRLRQIYRSEFQFKSYAEDGGLSFQLTIPIQQ